MKHKNVSVKQAAKWLIPLPLLILGVVFYFFVSGCSFLGIVFWSVAAIVAVYYVMAPWKDRKAVTWIRRAVSILLILVLIAALITLMPILRGPEALPGESDYLIVLGAGVRGTEPSEILQDRIDMAYAYQTKNPDAISEAASGNYEKLQKDLSNLLSDPEILRLLKQLGG
jgi:predicted PurR-regulated permease PerM